jgi:hypothetical protein
VLAYEYAMATRDMAVTEQHLSGTVRRQVAP